jgi:hypothetical protein
MREFASSVPALACAVAGALISAVVALALQRAVVATLLVRR